MTFDETVKQRREQLGFTQWVVAKESQMAQSVYARIERGEIHPTWSQAIAIMTFLDIDFEKADLIPVQERIRWTVDKAKKYTNLAEVVAGCFFAGDELLEKMQGLLDEA